MTPLSSPGSGATKADANPRLCVLLGCHDLVCALPVKSIDRLVLPEAAERLAAPPAPRGLPALPEVVQIGGDRYAAWDLGSLFDLGPVSGAWALVRVPFRGSELTLALRTGPCFAVQALRGLMKLPREIFRARRDAVSEGFATSAVQKKRFDTDVGLFLDPNRLWSPREIEASAEVLEALAKS